MAKNSAQTRQENGPNQSKNQINQRVNQCPIFLISSQARSSLKHAMVFGEWLNKDKRNLLYTADEPFIFQSLIQNGSLYPLKNLYSKLPQPTSHLHADQINDAKTDSVNAADNVNGTEAGIWPTLPCVIFASHPSLRLGPVVHLIRALSRGNLKNQINSRVLASNGKLKPPKNSLFLVESSHYTNMSKFKTPTPNDTELIVDSLLGPYKFKGCEMLSDGEGGPIGANLNVDQFNMSSQLHGSQISDLLTRIGCPSVALIVPGEASSSCDILIPQFEDKSKAEKFSAYSLSSGECLDINIDNNKQQPLYLAQNLAEKLKPIQVVENGPESQFKPKVEQKANPLDPRLASKSSQINNQIQAKLEINDAPRSTKQFALMRGVITYTDGKFQLQNPIEFRKQLSSSSKKEGTTGHQPIKKRKQCTGDSQGVSTTSNTSSDIIPEKILFKTRKIFAEKLIEELTLRGITGARIADKSEAKSAIQVTQSIRQSRMKIESDNLDNMYAVILFPNPNMFICLGLNDLDDIHIICPDNATRRVISSVILSLCVGNGTSKNPNNLVEITGTLSNLVLNS